MPALLTYEKYLQKPEEFISPAKSANLMKIIKAMHDYPGEPETEDNFMDRERTYMTITQVAQATGLQHGQINSAMLQQGMKVLFSGKGVAFGLSMVGYEVATGRRELTLVGVSKAKPLDEDEEKEWGWLLNNDFDSNNPLGHEDFLKQPEKVKAILTKQGKEFSEMLTRKYTGTLASCPDKESKTLLKRFLLFKFIETFNEIINTQTGEPVATHSIIDDGAKAHIKAATPNG